MPRPNRGAYLKWIEDRGCFYIQWYEQGRPRKRSTGFADVHDAEGALAQFIAERQRQRVSGPREPGQLLVTDVLAYYIEHHAETVADPTRIKQAVKALVPFWIGVMVDGVTKATCQRYQRERAKAVGTVRRELTTLRAAINFGHTEGILTRPVPVWLPEKPDGKDRWLTRDEAAALLNAARTGRSDVRAYLPLFIVLGLYTGKRKQAILELRWPQVDMKNRLIDFRKRDDDGDIQGQTSKRRGRQPIPNRLMTFLRLAHRRRYSDLGYVIHDKGRRIIDIGDGKSGSFGTARDRAGLSDVTPHTLRHTCGTWLAQKGVPLFQIGGWLDHSDARTTELYAHHHPDFQGEALDAFNRRG
jgi:integrase